MKNKYSMYELKKNLRAELEDSKEEILENEDIKYEIIDSYIPIYNYTLAMYLAENLELGFLDDGSSIYTLIINSMHEELSQELYDWEEENDQ